MTGIDGSESPVRRIGLRDFVVAPALDRTVGSNAARMAVAAGQRGEVSRRGLYLTGQRRVPADDRTVGAQCTRVAPTG